MSSKGKEKFTVQPSKETADGGAFVTYFPTGFRPDADSDEAEGCTFTVYRKKSRGDAESQKRQMLLVGETAAMNFIGSNFGGEAALQQPCQYALAICDREAGTLQFAPLAGQRVLRMDGRVRNLDYGAPPWEADPNGDSYAARMQAGQALLEQFASKKRQRTVARMVAEKRVTSDAVAAPDAVMTGLAAAVKDELTKAEVSALAGTHRNIPPHNPAAATPEAAYTLAALCDDFVLDVLPWQDYLAAAAKEKARTALKSGGKTRPYVLSRLFKLTGVDKPLATTRARALALLQALLDFHDAPHAVNDRWVKSQEGAIHGTVLDYLLGRFTEPEEHAGGENRKPVYNRPKKLRDLLLSYAAVCALMVEGYTLETPDLCDELKLDPLVLRKTFEQVGCKSRNVGNTEAGFPIYRVQLLSGAGGAGEEAAEGGAADAGATTLAQCLPEIKVKGKAGKKK